MLSFLKKRYILIVDDNKLNIALLSKILKDEYEIFEAHNGKEALDILEKNKFIISAVLLDIVMPVMNGYEFLEKIKSDNEISSIPVVIISQNDRIESEIKALSLGAFDFLTKPYNTDIIKHKISNIVKIKETIAYINNCEKDPLTNLYIKEAFYAKCEEIIFSNPDKDYSIITIDIENFKLINDSYGDIAGDRLLCNAANFLQQYVVPKGGVCSRLSGDVFACIVPIKSCSTDDIIKNSKIFNERYHKNIDISIKAGIYRIDDKKISVRKMCDMAKLALNTIKGKYEKYYAYYDDEIGKKIKRENQIAFDMQEALKEKQFKVYFQPKFDINTSEIVGAEALVRWAHPKMGLIMPNDFIPIFEKNGFVTDLDIYVWDYSCMKLAEWIKDGNSAFPISVNVSRVDFYDPDLCNILNNIVKKYNIPHKLLHLEITETAYSNNQPQLIPAVEKLKNSGFIIEMDDFGSGYSSLNVINEMPVDILKLDVKFLKNSVSNCKNNSILKFVINLANDLNFDVIAEGVETVNDLKTLEHNGCKYGQGYYFSRPIPEEEFEELLSKNKVDCITFKNIFDTKNYYEKDYIDILNTVPVGIGHFTNDFDKMTFANTTLAKILGYNSVDSLINADLSLRDIVNCKYMCFVKQHVEEMIETKNKKAVTFDVQLVGEKADKKYSYCSIQLIDLRKNIVQITFSCFGYKQPVTYDEMETLVNCLPGGFFKYKTNGDGKISFATESFYKMIGYSKGEFEKRFDNKFRNLIYENDKKTVIQQIKNQMQHGGIEKIEFRITAKNGDIKWFYGVSHLYTDENDVKWFYVVIIDNTEFKNLKEQSEINKERYECILPYTQDVIFEWDMVTNKVYTTDTYKQKFGYTLDEKNIITQIRANEYILDSDWQKFYRVIFEICTGKTFGQCEVRVKKSDESYIWCKITATSIKNNEDKVVKVIGILSDISEHKQKLANVQKLADTDYLTQTYNRTGFIKYINQYLKSCDDLSATLIIDIDYFKNINDTYGHKVGDKILIDIANILKNQVKKQDIVGRLGGDEFIVFLKNITDESEAYMFAQSICKQVEKNTLATCSIGFTITCDCESDFDKLYVKADSALYESKAKGRNTFTFCDL